MATFLITHRHLPGECPVAFAAWHGFESPLRNEPAISGCLLNDHFLQWVVTADDAEEALSFLPPFVAERSEVSEVRKSPMP